MFSVCRCRGKEVIDIVIDTVTVKGTQQQATKKVRMKKKKVKERKKKIKFQRKKERKKER